MTLIRPGTSWASSTSVTVTMSTALPMIAAACLSRRASPTTTVRAIVATCGSARALTMISGPMPAPSPMVTAMRGRTVLIGSPWG